jgi:hypothetical protein
MNITTFMNIFTSGMSVNIDKLMRYDIVQVYSISIYRETPLFIRRYR